MQTLTRRAASSWLPSAAVMLMLAPMVASADLQFVDVTVAAGLSYTQHVPQNYPGCLLPTVGFCEPERMTGGAAVADVDGDGDLDLFVTRLDAPDILFLNQGDGSFLDGTAGSGLDAYDLHSNGAGFADIDNDGDADLFVTVLGPPGDPINNRNYLFINDGTGHFSEQAVARGAALTGVEIRRTWSVAFGDFDLDGWVDIHVTEWLPDLPGNGRLLRNLGPAQPGFFEDVTVSAGVNQPDVNGFANAFSDLDGDGYPDLLVAADFGTSRLYWNDGDGTFTEGSVAAGVATDENGMGSTLGDYDGDGDLDWFVTSIWDPDETCEVTGCNWGYTGNRLYRNDGGRNFTDVTDSAGVRAGFWGWGAVFFDADNDGDLDLSMTNGVRFPGHEVEAAFNADPMRFWRNDGTGVMTEESGSVGLSDTGSGKGLLVFDYDQDGDLDLFVVNNGESGRLFRNDGGNDNDWLRVRVIGNRSNRMGLGATLRLQATSGGPTQLREIGSVSHFLGQSEAIAHFGLGPAAGSIHSLEVYFPKSKTTLTYTNLTPNSTLVVVEPAVPVDSLDAIARILLVAALGLTAFAFAPASATRRG